MACDNAARMHALFDGELDATEAVKAEQHTLGCSDCAALLADLRAMRTQFRSSGTYYRADPALRARVLASLPREATGTALVARLRGQVGEFWQGMLAGAIGAAATTAVAMMAFLAPAANVELASLTDAHLKSLTGDHLIEVASSDHHTVKPWFAGHADVSPPVADFANAGFALVGGRADVIDGKRAAVIVYRHGAHVINVFAWNGAAAAPPAERRYGYNVLRWQRADISFAAVSDADLAELRRLQTLIAAEGNKTSRP